jgi:hypothetical protein
MKRKEMEEEEKKGDEEYKVEEPDLKRQKKDEPAKEQLYLEKLKLASFDALNELSETRRECPKCKQSRKYFCYDCYIPINEDLSKVPRIQLPINVTVLRHPKEKISKSSIVPSKIISPDQVEIRHDMEIPPMI